MLAHTPAKEKQRAITAHDKRQQSAKRHWREMSILLGFLSHPHNFLPLYAHDCKIPIGLREAKRSNVAKTTAITTHSIVFGIDTKIPIFNSEFAHFYN
jgi:hypothetical protein